MKKHIYGIILFIIIAVFFNSLISYASSKSRVYLNDEGIDFTEQDEDSDTDEENEEDESEESGEGESTGPGIGPSVDEDEEEGGVPASPLFENIGKNKYWVGWRKHHYGYSPEPTTYKSQEVTFKYKVIRNGVKSYETSTAVANGYGIYNMDYSKHMIGFLSYAKDKYPDDFQSTFVDKTDLVFTGDTEPDANPISIKVACQKVMNKIIATWYSKDYEESMNYEDVLKADGFRKFWTENFNDSRKDDLRKVENEFFRNVYASDAEDKLKKFVGKFKEAYQPAIKGVIFSIMESRFRNKNLQGKVNLKLKVSEKELWPFYVYCEKDALGHVIWPEDDEECYGIDKVIDGAYQYMYYYDSEFKSSSHSTLTSFMLANETDEEPAESDWEAEYEELTGREFPYLYGNDLQAFYDRITRTRTMFTESANNAEGIFGAEEQYTNTSDFSFSKAMSKMQDAMFEFCDGTGIANIWTGLTAENTARSYLMAKNIVENERLTSEYAYYDIGTNILTYSAGRQDSTILLKDLQRVCLKQSINDPGSADTDEDGIDDKNELKSIGFPVDITKFVEKMVMSELYGKDQEGVTEAEKTNIMTAFKNNVRSRTETKRDDNSAECGFSLDGDKLTVYLYDYTSNPVIKDTDFDGLTDKEEKDRNSGYAEFAIEVINNKISGNMQTQDGQSVSDAETHMDYRYFFMNNKNYYDELSTMSLMLCNAFENPNTNKLNNINALFDRIGMNDNFLNETATIGSDYKINYITATNDIEYTHNADETPIKKKVKLVVVKSIDTSNPSLKNIENIGEKDDSSDYYSNNHETFDKLAKAIYDRVYVNNNISTSTDTTLTYWITGYNTGGAVANILSARIIDSISSAKSNADATNVYAYTFGAPYTVYNYEGEAINTTASKYVSIMNVTNEADIYAYMPPQDLGWSRYGTTCYKPENELGIIRTIIHNIFSPNEPIKNDRVTCELKYNNIFSNNMHKYRTQYYNTSDKKSDEFLMHEILKASRTQNFTSITTNIDNSVYINDKSRRDAYSEFVKSISKNITAFKNAKNLSLYYRISKEILPKDVTFKVSSDTKGYKDQQNETSQDYKTAVTKMMEWYVAHVATYQHKHDNTYKGRNSKNITATHTLLGSDEAEDYYDKLNLKDYIDKSGKKSYLTLKDVPWLKSKYPTIASDSLLYRNFGDRGLYYCQAYNDRMKGEHSLVGDDCTGFMMSVFGFYAGDELKDNDYAIGNGENFQINNIGTRTFRDHTRTLTRWLATQASMYTYEVTKDTTINDLEFGDVLVTCDASVSGHAEFFIDTEHTWGWGMKHYKLYDDGKLGWRGKIEKKIKTIGTKKVNCFNIVDKYNHYKDTTGEIDYIKLSADNRPYQYVVSPNPNKNNLRKVWE